VNIFYSVSANAAIGVAQQVNHAISGLVANFQTAYQPQITKAYAAGNHTYQSQLILQASKVSYFLMFIVSLPVIFNIDDLLNIWLDKVPEYSGQFCIYFMIASMLNAIGGPLWMSIFATGKIRNYQIATSIAYLSDIVIVYLLFLAGFPPVTAVVVKVFINAVIIIVRIFYCKKAILFFSSGQFLKNVLVPLTISTVLSVLFGYVAFYYAHTLFMKLGATFLTVLFSIAISYAIGLNKNEKKTITNLLFNYLKKK
jgi:O-antigen/teichoic acid export membrane protein